MGRTRDGAFSLLELLVVVVIIGLLASLLIPVVGAVWQASHQARCVHRLNQQWTAQGAYRASSGGRWAAGMIWPARLLPYVGGREEVFLCPAAPQREAGRGGIHEFSFLFYTRDGGTIFELIIDDSVNAVRRTELGGGDYALGVEDYYILERSPPDVNWPGQVPAGYLREKDPFGEGGWDDIGITIRHQAGLPYSAEVWGESESLLHHARVDFYINGELVLEQAWRNRNTVVPIRPSLGLVCDYGVSSGIMHMPDGDAVPRADPGQFLVLDYPQPLADYDRAGTEDEWAKFFILDSETWPYEHELKAGQTWRHFQALRHFGRANVLFCDGHVESLGVTAGDATEDEILAGKVLDESGPLWRYPED